MQFEFHGNIVLKGKCCAITFINCDARYNFIDVQKAALKLFALTLPPRKNKQREDEKRNPIKLISIAKEATMYFEMDAIKTPKVDVGRSLSKRCF